MNRKYCEEEKKKNGGGTPHFIWSKRTMCDQQSCPHPLFFGLCSMAQVKVPESDSVFPHSKPMEKHFSALFLEFSDTHRQNRT